MIPRVSATATTKFIERGIYKDKGLAVFTSGGDAQVREKIKIFPKMLLT